MAEDEYVFDDWDEESERIAVELEKRQPTSIPVKTTESTAPTTGSDSNEVLEVIAPKEKEIEAGVEENPVEDTFIPKKDPRSLWEKHRKHRGWGHVSVTDLVPAWCESQFVYRLSSMSHLPPALRPESIVNVETGAVIPIELEKNIEREVILKKGTAVHAVLEKETMGKEVKVDTTGEEEKMALRVVRSLVGLDVLLRTGITRELPVIGFLSDFLVLGVIDEVARREFPPPLPLVRPTTTLKRPATSPGNARPSTSKLIAKPAVNTLDGYFASTSTVDQSSAREETTTPARTGFMLSDSKTRSVNSIPTKDNSRGSRLQLMVYHQLLTALLLPPSVPTTPESTLLSVSPFSWDRLYAHISLSPTLTLCDKFLDQIKALVVDTSFEGLLEGATTLEEFVDAFQCFAVVFQKDEGEILEKEMEICYRLRNSRRYTPRKNNVARKRGILAREKERKAEMERIQEACLIEETEEVELARALRESLAMEDTQIVPGFHLPPIEMEMDDVEPAASMWELPVNSQAAPATPHRHDTRSKRRIISLDERTASPSLPFAIALPPVNPTPLTLPVTPPPASPPAEETHLTKGSIIGTDQFVMDAVELSDWLKGIVALWKGEKEPEGVSLENAGRCRTCEFEEGCEWRVAKAKEHAAVWEARKSSGKGK